MVSCRGICETVLSALLEYDTAKIVHIKSKKVGLINRLIQLAIIVYIIGWVLPCFSFEINSEHTEGNATSYLSWPSTGSKGRTIRKLMAGGRSTKKYSRKGKLNEKIHARQLTLQKYSCYDLKKNHARKLITKKNSCGSKIPHPPHNFSNGPSLTCKSVQSLQKQIKDCIELQTF